jgi:2-hydroxycyclohexanecarboxyl-CoA dehydrogenase
MGNPQLLINNAGWDKVEPFLQSDFATWDKLVQINLLAPITLSKLVAPGMIEAKWGRFVHISSDAARVGSTGEAVYSACKAGIVGFSKTIAREFARSGITSNVVCPGPTNTALLREVAGENEKLVESLKRNIPVGRIGEPKDVAGIVRFFCSDDAEYITGQTISVSGGLTMV